MFQSTEFQSLIHNWQQGLLTIRSIWGTKSLLRGHNPSGSDLTDNTVPSLMIPSRLDALTVIPALLWLMIPSRSAAFGSAARVGGHRPPRLCYGNKTFVMHRCVFWIGYLVTQFNRNRCSQNILCFTSGINSQTRVSVKSLTGRQDVP